MQKKRHLPRPSHTHIHISYTYLKIHVRTIASQRPKNQARGHGNPFATSFVHRVFRMRFEHERERRRKAKWTRKATKRPRNSLSLFLAKIDPERRPLTGWRAGSDFPAAEARARTRLIEVSEERELAHRGAFKLCYFTQARAPARVYIRVCT